MSADPWTAPWPDRGASLFDPAEWPPGISDNGQVPAPGAGIGASWQPVDLTAALTGGHSDPPPAILTRTDGHRLLYAGKVHTISGETESLKTWLALLATVEVIAGWSHVLFIDYEDSADGIAGRLLGLGCAPDGIMANFSYVRPVEPYGPAAQSVLFGALPAVLTLVIIDGVTEAMAAHGLNPLDNADAATFSHRLPVPFAVAGATVLMIDHVTKAAEGRGRYALGAQHKLAAVDGAAYTIDLLRPFGHGLRGLAKISIAKDRPGRVREHSPRGCAGMLDLESMEDRSVMARITPAPEPVGDEQTGTFRPTVLMERVSKTVEEHPGLSGRSVVDMTRGKVTHKRTALELLVAEGFVTVKREGNSYRHYSARPFREDQEDV